MIKWMNATWIFIGAVIGAGFASGQEVQSFFRGKMGLWGVVIAGTLLTWCIVKIFSDTYDFGITTYEDYLVLKTGGFSSFFRWISVLFCLCTYCVMAAGTNEVVKSFNGSYGGIVFALICFFVFLKDIKGVAIVNMISTPLIVVGMTIVAMFGIIPSFAGWAEKSIFYVSYNMLGCLPVMSTLAGYFDKRRFAVYAGLTGGITLFLLMLLIYFVLPVTEGELPMLDLAFELKLGGFYGIILILSMLTTAVSSGLGFIKSVKMKPIYANLILAICAIALLPFGFAALVQKLYLFFGIMSVILIFFIIKKTV